MAAAQLRGWNSAGLCSGNAGPRDGGAARATWWVAAAQAPHLPHRLRLQGLSAGVSRRALGRSSPSCSRSCAAAAAAAGKAPSDALVWGDGDVALHSGAEGVQDPEVFVGAQIGFPESSHAQPLLRPLQDAAGNFARVWPAVLQILPRLLAAACLLGVAPLLRAPPSLAHGAALASSHTPGLVAVGGSAWMQVARYSWMGLVAGCLHTLTGPDHLAALAPLTIGRSRVESAAIGALWGCGHNAGQIMFGGLFLVLKEKLHLELIRVWGSRVVALTLMAIGIMGVYEARMADIEGLGHHHHHDHHHHSPSPAESLEAPLVTAAAGGPSPGAAAPASRKASFSLATFLTGIVHGLQPDALLVILPALAMPSRIAGASFLALFLLGTVLAMGSYTAFLGSCSDALRDRVPGITKALSWGAAILALVLGAGMLLGEVFGFQLL